MQPGQQKITQFDRVNNTQAGDIIPIVRGGQNKSITVEDFTGVLPEGWLSPAEEWTFASFGNGVGVITVPEGNINRYPNGTRIWFKQGTPTATDRYGVVIASTTTSITIAMVNSTTLQNLAIQQPAISGETAPRTPQNVDFTTFNITAGDQLIGRWVDGKLLYRRVATATTTASLVTALGALPVGLDSVVSLQVMVRNTSDSGWRPIPWLFNTTSSSDWFGGVYISPARQLVVQAGASLSSSNKSLVSVEYTL